MAKKQLLVDQKDLDDVISDLDLMLSRAYESLDYAVKAQYFVQAQGLINALDKLDLLGKSQYINYLSALDQISKQFKEV